MNKLQYRNATAWMVRQDGSVFPVVQHIYGNPSNMEETLFAAEWLYRHTGRKETRKDIVTFACTWCLRFFKGGTGINEACMKVILDLNEEFMRVRFGGMYQTIPANRELYFRISSKKYNWSPIIMRFIRQSQLDYEKFYVVIDEESAKINPVLLRQSMLLRK